jgi:hypothetical protein
MESVGESDYKQILKENVACSQLEQPFPIHENLKLQMKTCLPWIGKTYTHLEFGSFWIRIYSFENSSFLLCHSEQKISPIPVLPVFEFPIIKYQTSVLSYITDLIDRMIDQMEYVSSEKELFDRLEKMIGFCPFNKEDNSISLYSSETRVLRFSTSFV